jgi:hypothetical protein
MLGGWIGVQTLLSALAAPAAAVLAEQVFGYEPVARPIGLMTELERAANAAAALGKALFATMVLPWIPCSLFFSMMHATVPLDRRISVEREGLRLRSGAGGGAAT